MTDIYDQASDREQLERDLAIQYSSKVNAVPATGFCLSCGELMDVPSRRFCDSFCRDDYQKAQEADKRNGVRK